MEKSTPHQQSPINWLTTIAISAIAISITIALHEAIHAVACAIGGGILQEFSALHVACQSASTIHGKIVAGSASVINIFIGIGAFLLLRQSSNRRFELQYFLWLFMLVNWLNGAGYWMLSGIANFGDWATVIAGWKPTILWRIVMALIGTGTYTFFVWFALKALGKIIGGSDDEQISRAVKLGIFSYIGIVFVVLLAGIFNPYGFNSSPVIGGLMAAVFGMSPLLWMMQWFQAKSFIKEPNAPLQINFSWPWVITAVFIIFLYAYVLGSTLYF